MTHPFAPEDPFRLDCRGRVLDARPGRALVMGILNVTPDSFSDGGRYVALDRALARTEQMLDEGAAIIDIGGESTRPAGRAYGEGAQAISADEERRRVLPSIQAIAARFPDAVLSIDTYKADVAVAALEAGAHLVNDVSGARRGDGIARAAARFGAPLVLMHARGKPGDMPHEVEGVNDVVEEVYASLQKSARVAGAAGVRHVVLDPGFGFGKSPHENLRLLAHTDRFLDLGRPVMVGISRKSTIGTILGHANSAVPVEERLFGTLGATAVAVMKGASLVRTHDVRATAEMLRVLTATVEAGMVEHPSSEGATA